MSLFFAGGVEAMKWGHRGQSLSIIAQSLPIYTHEDDIIMCPSGTPWKSSC